MTKIIVLLILASSCSLLTNQKRIIQVNQYKTTFDSQIYRYQQKRKDGSIRILYSNYNGESKEKRGILIYAQGSGCRPLLAKNKHNNYHLQGATYPLKSFYKKYWVFAFEKRGVNPNKKESETTPNKCSSEYHQHATLESRVKEYIDVLQWAKSQPIANKNKIIMMGFSEGTDIVAKVGATSNIPTHIGYFSGGGYTQMYDFLIFTRYQWNENPKDLVKTNHNVDGLMWKLRDVMAHPNSTKKTYMGHPYKRWASFFKNEPYKELLKFNGKIFVAHGGKDRSVPIESIDYIEIQFILNGRDNLLVKRYPNLNHSLQLCQPWRDKKCDPKNYDKYPKILNDFSNWIDKK